MRAWVTWLEVWRAFTKSKATQISSLGRPIKYLYSCHFDSFLNRADYWALAGIVAVDKGIEISNVECGNADDCLVPQSGLVFQWGRQVSDNISLSVLNSLYFERIAALLRTPPSMWACQEVSSTTLES